MEDIKLSLITILFFSTLSFLNAANAQIANLGPLEARSAVDILTNGGLSNTMITEKQNADQNVASFLKNRNQSSNRYIKNRIDKMMAQPLVGIAPSSK